MSNLKNEHLQCPIDLVLHIIEAKWIIRIIRDLCIAPRRTSELLKSLKGINPRTLTDRLRDLEKWNLVDRRAFPEIPPRVEYSLTSKGEQLIPVMVALKEIGDNWQKTIDMPEYVKDGCGHCLTTASEKKTNDCPLPE